MGEPTVDIPTDILVDDNKEILELLVERLRLGKDRYKHGVRIADDTRQWGTKENSWEDMFLEEALDGLIYAAASIIRLKRHRLEGGGRDPQPG